MCFILQRNRSAQTASNLTEGLRRDKRLAGSSFDGIDPVPEYQDAFEKPAAVAVGYCGS